MLEKKLLLSYRYILHLHITFNYRKKCTFCILFVLNNSVRNARGVNVTGEETGGESYMHGWEPRTWHSKITVLSTKKSVLHHKLGFLIHKSYTRLHNYTLV